MLKGLIVLTLIVATFASLDFLDVIEEAVGRRGERGIYFLNKLNGPVYANYDCDRRNVKKETSEWSANLSAKYKVVSGSFGGSSKRSKEYMIKYMDRTGQFTKIQPQGYLKEAAGLGCSTLYATVWSLGSDGNPHPFMNASGMKAGELLELYGSVDRPRYEKSFNNCGGDLCGCHGGYCWSTCMGGRIGEWCYTGTGYSQSYNYKRCRRDRDCQPSWKCAGACTV